jgi:hypothetical protein
VYKNPNRRLFPFFAEKTLKKLLLATLFLLLSAGHSSAAALDDKLDEFRQFL